MKDLVILTAAVLRDVLPEPEEVDAVFLFAQNDLQIEVIDQAAQIYRRGAVLRRQPRIIINDLPRYENREGSWGFKEWRGRFGNYSIPPTEITGIGEGGAVHTGKEVEHLLDFVEEQGWTTIVLIAVPYRMARCFLTTLGGMKARSLEKELKVYCATVTTRWNEVTEKHSVLLGTVIGDRFRQLEAEVQRIGKYREAYLAGAPEISPIASPEEGVAYLRGTR